MYTQLSIRESKSRRNRRCVWCGESIPKGSRYVREVGICDGDFQRISLHKECKEASVEYFYDEDYFEPHAFKRGTIDER